MSRDSWKPVLQLQRYVPMELEHSCEQRPFSIAHSSMSAAVAATITMSIIIIIIITR